MIANKRFRSSSTATSSSVGGFSSARVTMPSDSNFFRLARRDSSSRSAAARDFGSARSSSTYSEGSSTSWQNSTARQAANGRSEEHTSELQSLMRISYAVFCLKKK